MDDCGRYRPENKKIAMVASKMLSEIVKHPKVAHLILTSMNYAFWTLMSSWKSLKRKAQLSMC